ncbi:MAG TPA: hypothetical protein VGJ02_11375 [Pyrinomonadaceae bacterium]
MIQEPTVSIGEFDAIRHAYGVSVVYTNVLSDGETVRLAPELLVEAVLIRAVLAEAAAA